MKIKTKLNKIGNRKTIEKIDKTKRFFFEKVNKIVKPSARLRKKGEDSIKIRNERVDITTDATEIKRIIRNFY